MRRVRYWSCAATTTASGPLAAVCSGPATGTYVNTEADREDRRSAMRIGTIELDHLRGLGDKVVGLAKEVTGTVVGSDRLQEAGDAQQARGTQSLKALRKQAKAQSKEAKADTFEQQQKAAQRAKSA